MAEALDGSQQFYPRARAILQVVLDGFDTGEGSEDEPIVIPVLPKTAKIHGNGYNQADSWSLEFEYRDLPIDPHLIRSGSAEIYLYDAKGIHDGTTSTSRGRDTIDAQASDMGIAAKDAFVDGQKPQIAGLFDDASLQFDDGGKWLTISGQDYTAFLCAKQWPPLPGGRARRIPVGQRIDHFARSILAEADPGGKLGVVVEGVPSSDLSVVGKEIANHARGIPIQQGTSYWDVLYKTITRYGLICFIRGVDLVITKPNNLDDVADHDVKQMVWGRNLTSLQLTRHLGKERAPRIIIHAYDDAKGETHIIEEPPNRGRERVMKDHSAAKVKWSEKIKATTAKKTASKPKTKTEKITDEFMVIPVYGVRDFDALARGAKAMRALIGRGERKIVAKTRDLVDANGSGIMNLSAGDAVNIVWQDFNEEVLTNEGLTLDERVKHLTDRGYQQSVARAIASGYQRLIGKQRPLRLREYTYDYDCSDGLSIEMELVDFVMVDGVRDQQNATPRKQLDAILKTIGFGG
jgi:hypothetical protein